MQLVFGGGAGGAPTPAALLASAAAAALLLPALALAARLAAALWRHARLRGIPEPKGDPILGHTTALLSERSPLIMAEWAEALGPVFKVRALWQTLVVVADPAAAQRINRLPTTKPDIYRNFDLPSAPGASLFSHPGGAYWKALRAATAPCFSMNSLKRTFPWLVRLCGMAVDEVAAAAAAGAPVDVSDLAARLTSDTIGDMLLSKDLGGMSSRAAAAAANGHATNGGATNGSGPNDVTDGKGDGGAPSARDYIAIVRGYLSGVHLRLNDPLWRLRPGPKRRHAEAGLRAWDEAVAEVTKEVMAAPPPDYTIAAQLLRAVDPGTGRPLTPRQLRSELSVFYIAGFETTSHAITWALALLAAHPGAQARLAAELAAAGLAPAAAASGEGGEGEEGGGEGAPAPRAFEWGDVSRLPYLGAVVKEALRLFQPAAGGSARVLGVGTEVHGHFLPKGTIVAEPFFATSRRTGVYGPDANAFRPERWLGPDGGSDAAATGASDGGAGGEDGNGAGGARQAGSSGGGSPGAPDAMPFSSGPRDCIGRSLALLELQAVLATLVGRFEWALAPEEAALVAGAGGDPLAPLAARCCYHITLHPKGGFPLLAAPRRGVGAAAAAE